MRAKHLGQAGVEGQKREEASEEESRNGAALSHSHFLVVQVLCGGPRNSDPQGSWWTNQPGEREQLGEAEQAGPCQKLLRRVRRGSLPGRRICLSLSRSALEPGPRGQALLALYHAGGTWLSSTPQESAPTPRGRKWKHLGGGSRHSALT